MASGGRVPPWHEWFPAEALAEELPDPGARAAFVAELRALPLGMFEEAAPVVPGWPDAHRGYLRLSRAYDPALDQARADGWATGALDARHLSLYTDPVAVTDAMLDLLP